jgi:NTE family protein
MREGSVALVLGGGGARGAYEAGALSVLLPVLEERGERPRILIGTSAGALNVSFLAANAQLATRELIGEALATWESMRWGEVARRLISVASLRRAVGYAGKVLGLSGLQIKSLLDPGPLRVTLRERVDFDQIEQNVRSGRVDAAGVVATSALTGRSVVFHSGLASPPRDDRRGIDYVAVRLAEEHVLASAAIPGIFPAVHVTRPQRARGWYFDGGTRLNTPIKPALELGAARVVVVAVTSVAPGGADLAGGQRPDALEGAGQILIGVLQDQLAADVQTLAGINELLTASGGSARAGKRVVPYILVTPAETDPIAARALRVVREHYSGSLQAITSDVALLARLTAAGADARHAALLSFLLFAPEFAQALIELGQQDARRWIGQAHDLDELWQLGAL